MFLWFAGTSFVAVWAVFRSPAVDYRMVMLGSVLPAAELAAGRPLVAHTLLGAVAALTVVMLATKRRRLVRRRWLGIPIGMFCHLVFDGVWTDRDLFWWPAFGARFPAADLPEVRRGALSLVMELAGLAALGWMARRFRLREPARWAEFRRTGRLGRDLEGGGSILGP
jgi:hypothetical protein